MKSALGFGLVVIASTFVFGASPPGLINYQGVLRDSSGSPLEGSYDIVFAFYSTETGGDQIIVDSHTTGGGNAITVSNGLFSVQLGSGTLTDGTGPGTYTSLGEVFKDN
jgi:hypothetical protein